MTVWMPARAVAAAVVVLVAMAALLERSAPRSSLNAGRGRSRRSRAMRSSSTISGSAAGQGASGSASSASTASSSRSIRASSLMDIPQPGPQILERAELQLLHRALRAPERAGDLANAPLLDESVEDHALLVAGQLHDQLGEHREAVRVVRESVVSRFGRRSIALTVDALTAL